MEKLDVAVAVLGTVILVVATVGAVLSETQADALFALSVSTSETDLGEGSFPWDPTAQTFDEVVGFDVGDANVTLVRAVVSFTPTSVGPSAPEFAYHIELASPNGTSVVREASVPLTPSGAGAAVEIVVELALGPAPQNATVAASSSEEAAAAARGDPNATGAWKLTIQSARNAPAPTTVAWRAVATTFTVETRPTV